MFQWVRAGSGRRMCHGSGKWGQPFNQRVFKAGFWDGVQAFAPDKICFALFPTFPEVCASLGAFSSLLHCEYPSLTSEGKLGCSNKAREQSKMD